jgi:hypothetical protein
MPTMTSVSDGGSMAFSACQSEAVWFACVPAWRVAYTLGLMQPTSVETQEQTGRYRGFLRLMLGGVNRVRPVCHRIIIARLSLPHLFPIPDAAPGVDSSGSDRSDHLNKKEMR